MIEVTDEMLQVARSMKSFESMIKHIIELHEANKPKPEPVGYIYKHRLEQMLNSKVDNDCNFFPIKDNIPKAIFDRHRDKYIALYTTPPTREPLSEDELDELFMRFDRDSSFRDIARAVEQALGVTK